MGSYDVNINVNMGGGNFTNLVQSVNELNKNLQQVGASGTNASKKVKQSVLDLTEDYTKLDAKIKQFRETLKQQIADYNKLKATQNANSQSLDTQEQAIRDTEEQIRRLTAAQRQYNSVLGRTTTEAKKTSSAFDGLKKTFNSLAAVLGVSFGAYGAFRVLTGAIKSVAEFDLANKKLQSVLGETNEGMKDITDSAIKLGHASIFGAKGVTDLQVELAKMGFTKNEIMAMQEAINNLAIATQEDLATSAEVVANVLRDYQLSASESTRVTDVMGKAFNASALDLSNFREAIKYVATTAHNAGFTFEETVAALELLSNAGLKGSLAGTGFNNVVNAMMNSNSKLSKQLGGTVKGYDGFIEVLKRASKEGWSMNEVFGVMTQRSVNAFSIFKNGVQDIENFKKELESANGVMADQVAVQLESITYQTKLFNEQWKLLMIELNNGTGVVGYLASRFLELGSTIAYVLSGRGKKVMEEAAGSMLSFGDAVQYATGESNKFTGEAGKEYVALLGQITGAYNLLNNSIESYNGTYQSFLDYMNNASKAQGVYNDVLLKYANILTRRFQIEGKTETEFTKNKDNAIAALTQEAAALSKTSFAYKVYQEAIAQLNKKSFTRDTQAEENAAKLKDAQNYQLRLLQLQKETELARIKYLEEGSQERMEITRKEYEWDMRILDYKLQQQLISQKEYNLESIKLYYDFLSKAEELNLKKVSPLIFATFEKEQLKKAEQAVKEWDAFIMRVAKARGEAFDKLKDADKKAMDAYSKFQKENPLLDLLFGDKVQTKLLTKALDPEDLEQFTTLLDDNLSNAADSIKSLADQWVESTDVIVEQLNRQVDETQSALDTETELMIAGYANNVDLKKKELEQLKIERKKALEDQKKAQRAQLILEAAQQASGLTTSVVNVIQAESNKGILGIALALAGIASIFAIYGKFKALAREQSAVKFAKGGWIGGRSHAEGGTHIEAEKGEYVINKASAFKHKSLIEAINKDDKVTLNRLYLNGLKNSVISAKVSLDDSQDVKAIRQLLERKDKEVSYVNGYRIEKYGNITTKIRMN